MKEYIRSQNKTNELILNNTITSTELDRLAQSDQKWALEKGRGFLDRKPQKGDVYQFEFGKNYTPEISYEHRGLIIGVKSRLLYVLPVFTYKPDEHKDIYHPDSRPKGNLYLMKADSFAFIQHDSVLKLNDLRTVSVKRILYKQDHGHININADEYKLIERLVFEKYFPTFAKELNDLKAKNESLRNLADTKTSD